MSSLPARPAPIILSPAPPSGDASDAGSGVSLAAGTVDGAVTSAPTEGVERRWEPAAGRKTAFWCRLRQQPPHPRGKRCRGQDAWKATPGQRTPGKIPGRGRDAPAKAVSLTAGRPASRVCIGSSSGRVPRSSRLARSNRRNCQIVDRYIASSSDPALGRPSTRATQQLGVLRSP